MTDDSAETFAHYLANGHLRAMTPWGHEITQAYMRTPRRHAPAPIGEWITPNQAFVVVQSTIPPDAGNRYTHQKYLYDFIMPCKTVHQFFTPHGIIHSDACAIQRVISITISHRDSDLDPTKALPHAIDTIQYPIPLDADAKTRLQAIYCQAGAAGRLYLPHYIQEHHGHYIMRGMTYNSETHMECLTIHLWDVLASIHQYTRGRIPTPPAQTHHEALEDVRTTRERLHTLSMSINT